MNVDFNNLQKQALLAFEELTKALNDSIIKEADEQYAKPNDSHYMRDLKGYVVVEADDIQVRMYYLQQLLISIASCYEENDENFKSVYDEVFSENPMTSFGLPE
jgi:hypothetical protein